MFPFKWFGNTRNRIHTNTFLLSSEGQWMEKSATATPHG
ncbi:hypothetical protein HID58_094890 [Brassica napus]|uniref:Uncharacterized protein n=1 Tax=Brassica napus TaxID=3708 RepID=A0ABQ7X815_BRANA|nr:hypothetical protein HID58_094890 [Brassica napus]